MAPVIKFHRLANGLQLIGEVAPERQSAALGFFVKTGARDETQRESGLSHFLEHMMFKGTAKRNSLDITFEMGNIGAQANAFTSEENTVFYSAILPEYFSAMQELLSDMLRPSLDEHEFEMERKVILEEIALYQDRPHYYLMEKALKDYFAEHPAGNSVLGSNESISAVSAGEMRAYFSRRYVPSNMSFVASGNFNWEAFVSDAEKHCSSWQDGAAARSTADKPASAMSQVYKKSGLNQSHVMLLTRGASAQADERYALSVLSHILGDSTGSKLYWELIDTGLAESAGIDNDERDGTGVFLAYASTQPESADKVSEICRNVLKKPLDFSADELERAKTKMLAGIVVSGELPMGRLMSIGCDWNYRQEVESLAQSISHIKAVTRESIEAALNKFPLDSVSEFRLVPE